MTDANSDYASRTSVPLYENARLIYLDVKQKHVQLVDLAMRKCK